MQLEGETTLINLNQTRLTLFFGRHKKKSFYNNGGANQEVEKPPRLHAEMFLPAEYATLALHC